MPANARKHPREQVTLRVDSMDGEGRGGLGLATNLSYTGIALTSLARPLQVGDTLVLTFVTSPGKACKLRARVVHTHKARAGLVFTDAREAYRHLQGEMAAAFTDIPGDAPI
jgi:PilZ domain